MPQIIEIRLDPPETECIACGVVCDVAQGLPMYEGEVVENDYAGEWAGFHCCRPCYEAHRDGGVAGLRARLLALVEAGALDPGAGLVV